jgi:hypothetical protein
MYTRFTMARWIAALVLASSCAYARVNTPVVLIPDDPAPIAITSWLMSEPLPSPVIPDATPGAPERAGYEADYLRALGGEEAAQPSDGTIITLPNGRSAQFFSYDWTGPYLDMNEAVDTGAEVVAYLYAEIESDTEQTIYLHVGTNAAGKAWLGDQLVIDHPHDRVAMPSQNVARAVIPAGRTRLLLKVDHDGGGWGAFAEIYGQSAHRRFTTEQFPNTFALSSNNYLPTTGDTVTLRIANWIPPDPQRSVTWTVIDGKSTTQLNESTHQLRLGIDGPARALIVQATAQHPRGVTVVGECVVLVGGSDAARTALTQFWELQPNLSDLNRLQRDSYALALLQVEKAQRDAGAKLIEEVLDVVGKHIAALRVALDHFTNGTDPYAGRVGMVEAAYISKADGTAQPMILIIPTDYSNAESYSLFLNLHGASFTHELPADWSPSTADSAFEQTNIVASVMGRGRFSGYVGLGETDVLSVREWMLEHYPIDPDRVYIRGGSMGGMGTWKIAAQYPDLFAAAWIDCGWPDMRLLPNLSNVPTYINHGDADWSVPVAGTRMAVAELRRRGYPVAYREYPGVDHAVGIAVSPGGYMTHLAVHRRDTTPRSIHITATHPRHAAQYWGKIKRWSDPHTAAVLDARIISDNTVVVSTENVSVTTIEPPIATDEIVWLVNSRRITTPANEYGIYDIYVSDSTVDVRNHTATTPSAIRPYAPGSVMNLYRGEPLLIVYGTQSDDDSTTRAIASMAYEVSRWLAPNSSAMEFGAVPVVADTELTATHITEANLFLIGGSAQNTVVHRIMQELPVRESGEKLQVFDKDRIDLAERGYAFIHPNPESPQRLVFVYASSMPEFYTTSRAGLLRWNEVARDPYLSDLAVYGLEELVDEWVPPQLVRKYLFTHDWVLNDVPRDQITRHPSNRFEEVLFAATAWRNATGTDFAMAEYVKPDAPLSYDRDAVSWADIAPAIVGTELATFDVSGANLLQIANLENDTPISVIPAPIPASIDTVGTYRIVTTHRTLQYLGYVLHLTPDNISPVEQQVRIEHFGRIEWGVERE